MLMREVSESKVSSNTADGAAGKALPPSSGLKAAMAIFFAAAVIFFTLRGCVYPMFQAFRDPWSLPDFRGPYFSAVDHMKGEDPYPYSYEKDYLKSAPRTTGDRSAASAGVVRDGSGYLPIVEVLYMPFTFMDFPAAKAVWVMLQMFLVFVLIEVFARGRDVSRLGGMGRCLAGGLVMFFPPVLRVLGGGQVTLLMAVLLLGGCVLFLRGRALGGGILFALAALFKPIPAILFLPMFFLKEKGWWALWGGLLTAALSVLASIFIFGWELHGSYLRKVIRHTEPNAWWSYQSLQSLFTRLFSAHVSNPERIPWIDQQGLALAFWMAASALIVGLALRASHHWTRKDPEVLFSLWLTAGLLISPKTTDYYLVWLLMALIPRFARALISGAGGRLGFLILIYLFLGFPAVKLSAFSITHSGPWLALSGIPAYGMLLLYGLLLGECKDRTQ